ncbi:hypothetical protein [Anaerorhabdus sp.]|jgi:hypothetical protein|uniref:hypothetical protein n=1 Tax=Anaerorhabdus sp. TaxID=1872524 RepID=UPI002FCA03AF
MTDKSTTLPFNRIILAICYFLIVPILSPLINILIQNQLISYTFAVSLSGLLLMIQNWDLLEIHAKRYKADFKEALFFTFVGAIILAFIIWVNSTYVHAYMPHLDKNIMIDFSWFVVPIVFINTFIFAMNYVIVFKCVTDHLKLQHAEIVVILLSGFIFALLFTVTYIPFEVIAWLKGYLFYFVITLVISYLYNQTHSFLPGMIGFGFVLMVFNLISIFM